MRKPYTRWLSAPWRHVSILFWPVEAFKAGVLAVLRADHAYYTAFSESLHQASPNLALACAHVLNEIALPRGLYPEWVFSPGFNARLSAGYRYFLLKLDRLNDLLLASHELFLHHLTAEGVEVYLPDVKQIINHHLALLDVLIYFFETGEWVDVTSDEVIKQETPWQMNYLMWLRDQADIRDNLLELIMTLPIKRTKEPLC